MTGRPPIDLPPGWTLIPPELAGPVRDLLLTAAHTRRQTTGATPSPALRRLVEQLHQADQQHTQVSLAKPAARRPPTLVTVQEMARVMGCSRQYVRRLAAGGRLPARRAGRTWLIECEEDPGADRC